MGDESFTDCGATHIKEAEVRAELKRRAPGHTHEVDALEFYFFKEYIFPQSLNQIMSNVNGTLLVLTSLLKKTSSTLEQTLSSRRTPIFKDSSSMVRLVC
jgi:hypothetical protein